MMDHDPTRTAQGFLTLRSSDPADPREAGIIFTLSVEPDRTWHVRLKAAILLNGGRPTPGGTTQVTFGQPLFTAVTWGRELAGDGESRTIDFLTDLLGAALGTEPTKG